MQLDCDQLPPVDATMVEAIAQRVAAMLRDDVHVASRGSSRAQQLTVEQVAQLLGVARSTVYAHWREWGGYKLGASSKAPIRFDAERLAAPTAKPAAPGPAVAQRTRRRRRQLLTNTPRFGQRSTR